MLVALSPVEIEAKSEEAGLPRAAHDVALRMFHALTDRVGQAVAALRMPHDDWPNHRFFFGHEGGEMARLVDGLHTRDDIVDITDDASGVVSHSVSGVCARAAEAGFLGVLVAHENDEGFPSHSS